MTENIVIFRVKINAFLQRQMISLIQGSSKSPNFFWKKLDFLRIPSGFGTEK